MSLQGKFTIQCKACVAYFTLITRYYDNVYNYNPCANRWLAFYTLAQDMFDLNCPVLHQNYCEPLYTARINTGTKQYVVMFRDLRHPDS